MIGYKGFKLNENSEMYWSNQIYKLGSEYNIDYDLQMYNGIYFCWDINDVDDYYMQSNSVICEVEILGDIAVDRYNRSYTNKIKINKILNRNEIRDLERLAS